MDNVLNLYLIITSLAGIIILIITRHLIFRAENRSVRHVEKIKKFHSIRSRSNTTQSLEDAKSHAIEGLESSYSISRKAILLTIFAIWIIALTFPFLDKAPSAIISLVVGACTVLLGLAIKPFLENIVSGIVLTFSNKLRAGDTVIMDDHYGTIEDISMTHTTIKVWNWTRYLIPNSQMINKEILNYSTIDNKIWAHVDFWVSYKADLNDVKALAIQAVLQTKLTLDNEPPSFWVIDMEKDSIKCWIAAWVRSAPDAWNLKHEVRIQLAKLLNEHKIYPHYRYLANSHLTYSLDP